MRIHRTDRGLWRLLSRVVWTVGVVLLAVLPACQADAQFVAKLTASDGALGDFFGGTTKSGGSASLAIFGDTIIVGALRNDAFGSNSGAAYIFDRDAGGPNNWGEVVKLTPSDAAVGAAFGSSVSIYGDIAVVGASLDGDTNPDDSVFDGPGAAYVFARNQGGPSNWGQVAKLSASDAAPVDGFSRSSVYDDTIAVGAPWKDAKTGAAYVFDRNQGGDDNWGEVAKLTASDGAPSDFFSARAIFGDTVIAGLPLDDDDGSRSGSAYIFERNEGGPDNWGELTKLTASDASAGDWFGLGAGLFGDTAIVGAPEFESAPSFGGTGAAYIFERNQSGQDEWGEVATLIASDGAAGHGFGESVAIFGDIAVAGATKDLRHTGSSRAAGAAYIFARNAGGPNGWGEILKLMASDPERHDHFGKAVAVYENTVVVAAPGHTGNTGAAYVFEIPEPSALGLAAFGLLGIVGYRWRPQNRAK